MLRAAPGNGVLVVEGVRQQLTALSYAPDGWSVHGINGCDGIHPGIADRLPALYRGKVVVLLLDADWRTSDRVNGAATNRVPGLLYGAGAASVFLADNGGEGKAGLDDVLADHPEDDRAPALHRMMKAATEIEAPSARAQAIRDAVMDANDLDQIPDPVPLLAGYLNESEAVWMAGKFGTYKSLVALGWGFSVATSIPWSGATVKEPRPVVYVAAEGVSGLRKRKEALERHHGLTVPRGMLTIIRRPVHLERPEEVAVLREVIEQTGARLVILDTWHRMAGRADENSNTEQADPIDVALSLRDDYAATVLILDHTGHGQLHARGASAKEDDVDASWLIKLGDGDADDESRSINTPRTLVHRKAKDEDIREPERLRLLLDQGEAVVEVDPVNLATLGRKLKRSHHEQVKELIVLMDEAGLPLDMGYREVENWDAGRRPGRAASQKATREAVRARRGRAEETKQALELMDGWVTDGELAAKMVAITSPDRIVALAKLDDAARGEALDQLAKRAQNGGDPFGGGS